MPRPLAALRERIRHPVTQMPPTPLDMESARCNTVSVAESPRETACRLDLQQTATD
jgi:hypothetical protein